MAEEEVALSASIAVPSSDLKRKLGDIEDGVQGEIEKDDVDTVAEEATPDVAADAKRPRLLHEDVDPDGSSVSANGFGDGKPEEEVKVDAGDGMVENKGAECEAPPLAVEGVSESGGEEEEKEQPADDLVKGVAEPESKNEKNEEKLPEVKNSGDSKDERPADDLVKGVAEPESKNEKNKNENSGDSKDERPSDGDVIKTESLVTEEPDGDQITSRKVEIPNDKVGVLIGKGGDTIRYLQYNSGAKIQIMRDAEADPRAATRPVEIIGKLSSIIEAEKLINAVIAEADAGGSPALIARGLPSAQNAGVSEQLEMQVPNEKVGLIIGRRGDNIKSLQARSGARIQLIPQHLPEGDGSKDRTVRLTGDRRQIETAREMILDVMTQPVRRSPSGGYNQQRSYGARGPGGPAYWGQRGPHSSQSMPYDYPPRGGYQSPTSHYGPPSYGGYPPQHMAPRGNMGPGWEQRPPSGMHGPFSQGGSFDYYGGQGHGLGHASRPSGPAMGPPPYQTNYNYGQSHGSDYGHQAPYSQAPQPQQNYGHGHEAPTPYGPGSYPQASNQPGYGTQQQYGKQSSYGMASQGPPPQSYGPPRPNQPGEVPPYQGSVQSAQSYGSNVPSQQQYPYAPTASAQQPYPPYGSTDAYGQAAPASAAGYPQQSGQPVSGYGQSGGQQAAGYVQGNTGSYGAYPSQQTYAEQPAAANAAYGYQQDPAYASNPALAYGAQSGQAPAYSQPASTQTTSQPAVYDQSVPQQTVYASGPVPAGYAKTVSPQPATYPQYDSTQVYAAPH